jgi:hypothetical protein
LITDVYFDYLAYTPKALYLTVAVCIRKLEIGATMAVLTVTQSDYHDLGWAIKRLMSAQNIEASNQTQFASFLTQEADYPMDQRTLSSYMRLVEVKEEETGRVTRRPRVRAPESFVAALLRLPITDEQREDIITGWVAIQKPERREALRQIFSAVKHTNTSSEAWREMLDYEADRSHGHGEDDDDASSGGREEAV